MRPRRHLPMAARPAVHSDGVMLAQSGDVEIYYDEFGRRVVVDAYTGEILSVERPRRLEKRREELRRSGRTFARSATISTIRKTWPACAARNCATRAS